MVKKLLLLFLFTTFLAAILFSPKQSHERPEYKGLIHEVLFFEESSFFSSVDFAKNNNKSFNAHATGGIIPHHLFASFMIADFFNRISNQKPKTIILIGPNHYELGKYKALTSLYSWKTLFGNIEPDTIKINKLISSELVYVDENTLPNDHSVSGILPFIKYYLPDTKIVPILVSKFMTYDETVKLADGIAGFNDSGTIVVSAVDFSHYLTSYAAKKNDDITLGLINNYMYRELITLNSDYLDSPQSIILLLMAMQKRGTVNSEVLYHTNSGEMTGDEAINTTSYFSIIYY